MPRPCSWTTLAVLGLALSAGLTRAQPTSSLASCRPPQPASALPTRPTSVPPAPVPWEFRAVREDDRPRLQVQTGPGVTATCESLTFQVGDSRPVTVSVADNQVQVRCRSPILTELGRHPGIQAGAYRVIRGGADGALLTLEGQARLQYQEKGDATIRAERIVVNLLTGQVEVELGALTGGQKLTREGSSGRQVVR
jgi:hypothetical protein